MDLNRFSVLVIGAGSVGVALLQILGGMGFGEVGIVDGDVVELKNIKNQPIYTRRDAAGFLHKSEVCARWLAKLDVATRFISYPFYVTQKNVDKLVKRYDFIIDATDNNLSRSITNTSCFTNKKPLLMVSARDREGIFYLITDENACFNCILRNSNLVENSCTSINPSLSSTVAEMAINVLIRNIAKKETQSMFSRFSAKSNVTAGYRLKKDPACEVCGSKRAHVPAVDNNKFIQACGDGIKFSFQKKIDLPVLARLFGGKNSGIVDECLLVRAGRKSFLVSGFGDVLFTGYNENEARVVLARISSVL